MANNLTDKDKKVKIRKRNWAFVAYPESLPKNWQEILTQTGLPIAISPLHDKDENPDGTKKKPHYHVILVYLGPTSFEIVKKITDSLNAPAPIALEAIRGYYRYLTHKDNPEKHQYAEKDIKTLNDFSVLDFVEIKKSEVVQIKKSIIKLIYERPFLEYMELLMYALNNLTDAEFEVISSHTIYFNTAISSNRNMRLTRKK
jgi:hypothetical protein